MGRPRERRGRAKPVRGGARSPARLAALNAALLGTKRGLPLDEALDQVFEGEGLGERDRRLATEIAYGSARHRGSIDLVLAEVSSRPVADIQDAVLEALRGAVYQAFYLERIPEHAAVDEAVRLARSFSGSKAAGFANAVLRAALPLRAGRGRVSAPAERGRSSLHFRGGELILLKVEVLPDPQEDLGAWLAGHYSYPPWLVGRLLEDHGLENAEEVLRWGNEIPHIAVRLNRLRCDPDELAGVSTQALCSEGAVFAGCDSVERGEHPCCYRIKSSRPSSDLAGLRRGIFSVQDCAQQRAAETLAPRAGERILDLCAAPGGKSAHIAEISGDRATLLATDASARRLKLVEETAARLGLSSISTRQLEVPPLPAEFAAGFDRVLADVPCSNTGAMNRRVESRWRARPRAVGALAQRQRDILDCAIRAVRPGGRLVYSTCSLLAEENGAVVRAAIAGHRGVRISSEEVILPRRGRNDGAYLASLEA
jgi:16S rRNA (cytosine967-C5)-methyltransferase